MQRKAGAKGFTLLELLIVMAVIVFLSGISVPSIFRFLAKSKRSEAYMTLRSLYMAEKAYWAEFGRYTNVLRGADGLGWKPEGMLQYTYGFPGQEGVNNFVGALKTPSGALEGAHVNDGGFVITAAGDIDGDGKPDVLTVDQSGTIVVLRDDLAD
jgi:type IV pilus assembly protein PilA